MAARVLNPLITPRAAALLIELQEHPHAPRWNYRTGDWITAEDLAALERFRADLFSRRGPRRPGPPEPAILQRLAGLVPRVEWLRRRIDPAADLAAGWDRLPAMTREDLATDMGSILPDDCDLSAVAIYETSGTSGHRLPVPNSARGASSYCPLLEVAMACHGVAVDFSDGMAGAFLVGAQAKTVTYATVHAVWANSGYAKLNLRLAEWPRPESPQRYLDAFAPPVLCGDPIAFAEMLRWGLKARPRAMLSTAVALPPALAGRLTAAYGCPVIDTYSLNETGLVAYACRDGFFHVLPHDIHVEILDAAGRAAAPGQRGEIAVSGGRNPYLPLLRYRTGDFARLDFDPCPCGDGMPRLLDLLGRSPVVFRASDGSAVNTVDLSRVFREFPLVQHRFRQAADRSCEAVVRPLPGVPFAQAEELAAALAALLGDLPIAVVVDPQLGRPPASGKVAAYESALTQEDLG